MLPGLDVDRKQPGRCRTGGCVEQERRCLPGLLATECQREHKQGHNQQGQRQHQAPCSDSRLVATADHREAHPERLRDGGRGALLDLGPQVRHRDTVERAEAVVQLSHRRRPGGRAADAGRG